MQEVGGSRRAPSATAGTAAAPATTVARACALAWLLQQQPRSLCTLVTLYIGEYAAVLYSITYKVALLCYDYYYIASVVILHTIYQQKPSRSIQPLQPDLLNNVCAPDSSLLSVRPKFGIGYGIGQKYRYWSQKKISQNRNFFSNFTHFFLILG